MTDLLPETDPFVQAKRGIATTGTTDRERALIELLAEHGAGEGELLAAYERLEDSVDSPAIRYLIQLVMDDERRHHRVLGEIANAIAWGDHAAPIGTHRTPPLGAVHDDPELRDATRDLLAFEHRDVQALRALREAFRDAQDTTIWALLIDLMILDTKKHARILEFILGDN